MKKKRKMKTYKEFRQVTENSNQQKTVKAFDKVTFAIATLNKGYNDFAKGLKELGETELTALQRKKITDMIKRNSDSFEQFKNDFSILQRFFEK